VLQREHTCVGCSARSPCLAARRVGALRATRWARDDRVSSTKKINKCGSLKHNKVKDNAPLELELPRGARSQTGKPVKIANVSGNGQLRQHASKASPAKHLFHKGIECASCQHVSARVLWPTKQVKNFEGNNVTILARSRS
jgi:hypothetical protein